jgi:hypothetical protein
MLERDGAGEYDRDASLAVSSLMELDEIAWYEVPKMWVVRLLATSTSSVKVIC